ncbi:hypothetical protein KBB96_15150 [Luteolibacter ambystomatis]|uniref:PepSY domain-containing protein n=1 Tax=Luteolibacter ambystomatis TaxID=2824561 RepID=A0A975G8E0_9BACT|nr:hypothetical protein [Luteolibacter ambystomatis]QUE50200.1 hypothetical protein KBB96_15150 [Luteolibacter ambystomatis]
MMKKSATILILAGLALPVILSAKEEKKGLALDQVPAKVAAAIRAAAGNEPVQIKAEKEDGVDAFEAKWSAAGHKHEITVGADGTVLSQEEVIAADAAPAPVQAAIKTVAAGGKVEKVEKVTEKGTTVYEAEIETAAGEVEVKFDASGKEIARETKGKEKEENEEKDDDDHEEQGGK